VKVICVGGLSSGCGKTSVVCMLLTAFPGWAAIKVTPSRADEVCPRGRDCEACQPPEGRFEVTIDEQTPLPGKDTARFAEAGASHVVFVRGLPECLPEALWSAFDLLAGVPGVIVESTTAVPIVDGLRMLVAREGVSEAKDSARAAVGLIDLFVINQEPDAPRLPRFESIPLVEEVECRIVTACAALSPDHERNGDFITACRLHVDRLT
jgi:hypothetical protein